VSSSLALASAYLEEMVCTTQEGFHRSLDINLM
jgi:hypothetical protein